MLPRIKENPGFVAVTTETKILIAVEISHLDIDHEFKCNFMSLCVCPNLFPYRVSFHYKV